MFVNSPNPEHAKDYMRLRLYRKLERLYSYAVFYNFPSGWQDDYLVLSVVIKLADRKIYKISEEKAEHLVSSIESTEFCVFEKDVSDQTDAPDEARRVFAKNVVKPVYEAYMDNIAVRREFLGAGDNLCEILEKWSE